MLKDCFILPILATTLKFLFQCAMSVNPITPVPIYKILYPWLVKEECFYLLKICQINYQFQNRILRIKIDFYWPISFWNLLDTKGLLFLLGWLRPRFIRIILIGSKWNMGPGWKWSLLASKVPILRLMMKKRIRHLWKC